MSHPDSPERTAHDVSPATPSRLPLRMLHDRILVQLDKDASERRSASGIVIPATASLGRRLAWALVVAAGPSVRQVSVGDRVLFDPEDRSEVEVATKDYILLRERDLHAVAEPESRESELGLYL
ncbi:chaperonin [Sinomonas humi]|uniref:10 kDa chaperonin n=2 Tax=Sinomonas humi TaxID=1338436 RepID=A0A0B2AKB4_9MICC|nr:chaperonin [Sinomonas humi]